MEILMRASLYITQFMDNENRRCAECVRELLDLRDGLLYVDIKVKRGF